MRLAASIFGAVVVILAGWFLWQKYGPQEVVQPPPPIGNVTQNVGPNVTHGSPSLPKPDAHTTGILRVVVPPESVYTGKPREVYIYIQDNPKTPPVVRSDTPISTTFHAVVDPWLMLQTRLMLGGSLANDGDVSPWGGVALVRLFNRIDTGAGIDEDGIGVFISYQVWREFEVGAMWYALPVFDSDARAALVVSYRF